MTNTLTAENVATVFKECLFAEGEATEPRIEVKGIVTDFGFHPERTKANAAKIGALLAQLPEQFHATCGGGWSFLNACMRSDGVQWGEHRDMEALFALGIATEQARWQLPRAMWDALPGGMPYVVVDPKAAQP